MKATSKAQNPAGGPGSAGAFAGSGMQANHTEPSARGKAFARAAKRRDRGLASSNRHAEEHAPGWTDRALCMLERFTSDHASPWTCEQFRAWAEVEGLDSPPEKRAFGAVIQGGLRAGWFVRVGYAPAASSNFGAKPLYQAARA